MTDCPTSIRSILVLAAFGVALSAGLCETSQIAIPRVEQMPNMPSPYRIRDWQKVARDFDTLAFDFEREGDNFPIIKWRVGPNAAGDKVFAIDTFVGKNGAQYEAITCLGAVNAATVAGIDKSNQHGENWVRYCANFLNDKSGINIYLNNPNDRSGYSFWYELFPNILFYRIFCHYPETEGMAKQFITVADRWIDACVGMGGRLDPWTVPDFNHTAYNFVTGKPHDNGLWREGGSAAAIAWLEYMAYAKTGKEKYLSAAKWGLDYLQKEEENPYYEILFPHGPYIAARMNAEQGTQYDIRKLVSWCFDGSNGRGWGETTGRWGEHDFSGVACSLEGSDLGTYAFPMNTFNKANSLVPMVRYDPRFARTIGKWMLNAANSMRLFYANGLPPDHQTDYAWAAKHDPDSCLAYEAIRRVQSMIGRLENNFETRFGRVKQGRLKHTQFTDKRYQVFEETRVGDSDRLEHIWKVMLPEADSHNLNMVAMVGGREAFAVSYSSHPEGPFTQICVFDSEKPAGRGGKLNVKGGAPLYLKVTDADPNAGNDTLDSFSVDDVWIVSTINRSPFATGDAKANGWARTNFGLYGSSFAGLFGGIIKTTNVKGILRLDCLATDYFHAEAYPTYLYYNPFDARKKVVIDVGSRDSDLYDAVSDSFLKKNVDGKVKFTVPADSAVLLIVAPAKGNITRHGSKMLIDGIVVDYTSGGRPVVGKPNILLITADDMNYDSLGCMGNPLPGITPNLDRLAAEGVLFTRCYNTSTICGPSRASLLSGLYPQCNGNMGHGRQPPGFWEKAHPDFEPPSVTKLLHDAGYFTALLDKSATRNCIWDYKRNHGETGAGRDPRKFYSHTKEAIEKARAAGKPFFINANPTDPHRYWAGHPDENPKWIEEQMERHAGSRYANGKPYPDPDRTYSAEKIPMPPCFPEDPKLRASIKHYYGSVNRLDMNVGLILKALDESGARENTLVMFLSDHGMGWAFAKWSLYPYGTRTPFILRYPQSVTAGRVDDEHVLSTVDIAPTVLEAVGLKPHSAMHGLSLWPLLSENADTWTRNDVLSCFDFLNLLPSNRKLVEAWRPDLSHGLNQYRPMRSLTSRRYVYVWNAWSNGKNVLPREMGNGGEITRFLDSNKAKQDNKERSRFYKYRVPEELYNTEKDPGCRNNLVHDPAHQETTQEFRQKMLAILTEIQDAERQNYIAVIRKAE